MVARFVRVAGLPPGSCRCEEHDLQEIWSCPVKARLASPGAWVEWALRWFVPAVALAEQMVVATRDSTRRQIVKFVILRRGRHSVTSNCLVEGLEEVVVTACFGPNCPALYLVTLQWVS
jgi:hypothetical protein